MQNSFMMGPLPHHDNFRETNHYDYEPLILQCMHETAHLFWQVGDSSLVFGFGQWAWEAAALIAEKLLMADYYGDMPGAAGYDLHSYSGWETVNGVMSDGNEHDRTLENGTASEAFFMLATVLSAGSGNTYVTWDAVAADSGLGSSPVRPPMELNKQMTMGMGSSGFQPAAPCHHLDVLSNITRA